MHTAYNLLITTSRHGEYPQHDYLGGLVDGRTRDDVLVQHRDVVRRDERICVHDGDEYRAVDHAVRRRLHSRARVVACQIELRIRRVQLRDPRDERGGPGGRVRRVQAVGPDGLAGGLPLQVDDEAGVGERLGAVVRDRGTVHFQAVQSRRVRVVLKNRQYGSRKTRRETAEKRG